MAIYSVVEIDLLKLARRLALGNEDRAQDLLQETVLKAYTSSLERPIDASTAKPWMMRIMTNTFINEYRRTKKWTADVDFDAFSATLKNDSSVGSSEDSDEPGVALIASTLDEELEAALGQLSESLRLTVTLVDMQGLEYAEAASILGVPIGTVRSRLSRARMQLHDLLQDFARRRRHLKSTT